MFVEIDVDKADRVVSILPAAERVSVANDEPGVRTLVECHRVVADEDAQELEALLTRRRQLLEMLQAERNRTGQVSGKGKWVKNSLTAHISYLERELRMTHSDLGALSKASPVWRKRDQLLRSVPGVGPLLSRTSLADLPELGQHSRRFQIVREALVRLGLTSRQIQVAYLMAERYSHKEIAEQLGIKPNTARRHCEQVLTGLGVHSRYELRQALLRVTVTPER